MSLVVQLQNQNNACVVRVCGEVDVSNAPELRSSLEDGLSEMPSDMTVDLSDVSYIDSTGIGVLVGAAHKASEAGIPFAVENPQRNVARVLSLLGVDGQLGIRA